MTIRVMCLTDADRCPVVARAETWDWNKDGDWVMEMISYCPLDGCPCPGFLVGCPHNITKGDDNGCKGETGPDKPTIRDGGNP